MRLNKPIKNKIVMRLICLCWLAVFASLPIAFSQTQDSLIQRLGDEFMKAPEAVGLSVGVLHLGKADYYNFGIAQKGVNQPAASSTIYEIGSNTKTFVSTLLAYAVIEGKIKLDDDIRTYMPEQYPNLEYQGQAIKLLHLANLTSELPNWLPDKPEVFEKANPDSIPYLLLNLHKNYSQQDFYRDLHSVRLVAQPGSNPRHSNVAAQLVGFILESVYQQSLESLIKKYITEPLGMNHTGFFMDQPKLMAKGYSGKGKPMPYITMPDAQGSGGLSSTAEDMLNYIRFQLDESNKAVRLSHQTTVKTAQDAVGLNWHIDKTPSGDRQLWHTGGTFGFSSYIVLYPDRQLGIVLLANESDSSTQTKLVGLSKRIAKQLEAKN
jgi:D-alanyl-D-alanine-carboxypeptidase/D-alanyl-D-alanine-endopeptidase